MQIEWAPSAEKQLHDFLDYYEDLNQDFVGNWEIFLETELQKLEVFPRMGNEFSFGENSFRTIYVKPVTLVYEVFLHKIAILGLHHERENYWDIYF